MNRQAQMQKKSFFTEGIWFLSCQQSYIQWWLIFFIMIGVSAFPITNRRTHAHVITCWGARDWGPIIYRVLGGRGYPRARDTAA